jgi:7-cyano-7-deazaguanine synthase in queuosine biosynthesis
MAVCRKDQGENAFPSVRVDVTEAGTRTRPGRIGFEIDSDLKFSTSHLESYCLAQWEPVVFDTFVVAAAVEFCDRVQHRPAQHWGRDIELRIPVHEPDRWRTPAVSDALHDALRFLTGDRWAIAFVSRQKPVSVPRQIPLEISGDVSAVIPFSDGLDSRAVAGLMGREMGDRLVRVRMGSKLFNAAPDASGRKQPFTSIPYRVKQGKIPFVESSARSRGFKFAMVGGLAAYLIKADRVIMPESGQGSLGPALVPVGQAYDDYRNHPLFSDRMERLLAALFGRQIRFEFPRLWHTKGETLAAFANSCADGHTWEGTWSCWQQTRQVSVNGRKRQCGICAACMLRRLSVHAAGLDEPPETYVWENLSAPTFETGAASGFTGVTGAQREYAIAGALHLDHLAALRRSAINASSLDLAVSQLSRSRALPETTTRAKLDRLLDQHESEWKRFLAALGPHSFVAQWAAQP